MRSELVLWKPFKEFSPFHREMDNLFGHFFGNWERDLPVWFRSGDGYPSVESYLEGDKLIIKADLPGVNPKDVEVSVANDQLTIKGERKVDHQHTGNGSHYAYREVRYGRFERSLPLPEGTDADGVSARYHDGVLDISLPAPKAKTTRQIPIEAK